jgi:hypothetical protein
MYKICFYAPENAVDIVKQALFSAGAGRIGNYDSCCWQALGSGQFRPLDNSNPTIGKQGNIETVSEYKVEMVCEDQLIKQVIKALRQSHPYEEPAYDIVKLEDF